MALEKVTDNYCGSNKMFNRESLERIEKQRKSWEENRLAQSLKRFGLTRSPNQFYTPLDIREHDFLRDVGFPGRYPFTAGRYPTQVPGSEPVRGGGHVPSGGGLIRAGRYSGYGTAEDSRDYYKYMISRGQTSGPNLAFDLPTQCGLDPDDPMAKGEVGRVGVAISTLRDMEILYEAFVGDNDLDKIHSAYTINPLANVILAMYIALAEKRGIPLSKIRCTPQNDILKEAVARGTQIFPLKHSMRMTRDTIVYGANYMPLLHPISITGYHFREAGATRVQTLAFTLADAIAYVQLGIKAGLDVDTFIPRLSFLNFSGSMELFKEVALRRAGRRMWAKITKERFKAKDTRSWIMREVGNNMSGTYTATVERPLNNLTRTVIGGVAAALSGDIPTCYPPYDEPLRLGHSMEALQLTEDAGRILVYEAKLCDVMDPLAGSYYVESLTDQTEAEAWEIIEKIDEMGGMVAAIESGYIDRAIAESAYQFEKEIESGERVIVGVNRFVGESEIEVTTNRLVPDPYDPEKRVKAEERQIAKLFEIRKQRDNKAVAATLKQLKEAAQDETVNIIPVLVEAVKTYASVGEICQSLKEVFGNYQQPQL
jgi:methylmalonyl-CoA mutase N-terminal domain/subunit